MACMRASHTLLVSQRYLLLHTRTHPALSAAHDSAGGYARCTLHPAAAGSSLPPRHMAVERHLRVLVGSRLPPRHVVVEHHLRVLVRVQLDPPRVVSGPSFWVDVDHLAIALVLEEQASLIVRNHLEVGRRVRRRRLRLPIIETQVGHHRHELLLALKVGLKVLRLETVRVINVARYLLPLGILVTDEDDRRQLAVPHHLLALSERRKEWETSHVL
mmetsp:Transcript_48400/g.126528  ORF Transcript_48400/g.126528 Transcript_48400/m.126528 type:complete len:216 (-) Transcript_48400:330-977(-)